MIVNDGYQMNSHSEVPHLASSQIEMKSVNSSPSLSATDRLDIMNACGIVNNSSITVTKKQ